MRLPRFKKGSLALFTFFLPRGGEFFQLLLFLFLVLFALWRVEGEEGFLWFEEEGRVELILTGVPHKTDKGLRIQALITGGDFPEIYHKRVLLTLYGAEELRFRTLSLWGKVRAEGRRIYIGGSYASIEPLFVQRSLRDRYIDKVESKMQDPSVRALVLTYFFGESMEVLPQEAQHYFLRTGLVHLLVISGFHVGMIFLLLRFAMPYPYGLWLGALGVSLYVFLLVPSEPPVLRAWLMLLLWVFVRLNQASPNGLGILLFSASLLLFIEPEFVHSFSFWLSFFATLYILLGMRLLPSYGSVFYRYLVLPFGVS
ncbi:MAG: ComEC/Rec2 family competence protein, partial [Aquificaceae bacterium]|nr:ComEC/Rec2 family competence protein [Aquificaceae bacterium]